LTAKYTLNDKNKLKQQLSQQHQQYSIICNGLTKIYGSQIAVDHINLKIRHGSIFGLLGPNGAGKTTIIKMLTGLTKPSDGEAYICRYDIIKDVINVKENIGWISSEVILDDSLTIMENIWLQSKLHGIGKHWKKKAIELLKYFELDETDKKKVGQFSTGMRKKLEITMALLHEPKVLFMDEPTIGLDANTRISLWNLIKKINKLYSVTILLTTHYIEEADILCDNLAIINHGKIIANGSPQELKSMMGDDILEIEFSVPFDFSVIKNIKDVKTIKEEKDQWSTKEEKETDSKEKSLKLFIKVKNAETVLPEIITAINKVQQNIIKSIKINKPNLESIFLELTGKRFDDYEEYQYK
jgi:ABC-2 type transport system ATP-binding protein